MKMAHIQFKGKPLTIRGAGLKNGQCAPDFVLIDNDFNEIRLSDFSETFVFLNIVPSLDTPVCAASAREFEMIFTDSAYDCHYATISRDLPFAQSRFAIREELQSMQIYSDMRFSSFAEDYGVLIDDGPLKGLCARAVIILGPEESGSRRQLYRQLVGDISREPDYQAAKEVLDGAAHRTSRA